MTKQPPLSPRRIVDARTRIDPLFLDTPLLQTNLSGLSILAKDETDNPIRSFKGRGTSFYLAENPHNTAPLVTASAGNFGQGLAYNAGKHGRSLIVFASVNASPVKIEAMRRFGAEVILAGDDFDAAKTAAKRHAEEKGLQFVEDGAEVEIAEGAGTIAAELTDYGEAIDAIYIPLGNGALAAGIGCWFRMQSPETRIIAVASSGAPCMALSYRAGKSIPTEDARTIADGIAVRIPVPQAVEWLKDTIDDVVLVDDDQILAAMRFAHERWGRLVEPAGAAGLAAILAKQVAGTANRVATILCGGNLTDTQIASWLPSAGNR
jgi:threonine dehydratase